MLFLVEVPVGVVLGPKVKMEGLVWIRVESRAVISGSALKLFCGAVLLHPGKVTYRTGMMQLLICDE